jgi:hypothetical protein
MAVVVPPKAVLGFLFSKSTPSAVSSAFTVMKVAPLSQTAVPVAVSPSRARVRRAMLACSSALHAIPSSQLGRHGSLRSHGDRGRFVRGGGTGIPVS